MAVIALSLLTIAFVLLRHFSPPEQDAATPLSLDPKIPENSASFGQSDVSAELLPAEAALVAAFLDNYYESLASLYARDLSYFFGPNDYCAAQSTNTALFVTVEMRRMQPQSLTLASYSYSLRVESREVLENGDVSLVLREDSVVCFSAYAGVESKCYDFKHEFVLTQTPDGLRIALYDRGETLYNTTLVALDVMQRAGADAVDAYYAELRRTLIEDARLSTGARLADTAREPAPSPSFDVAYDRSAALAYSYAWVQTRNPDWPVYDNLGGNCNNYASQCLLAGGIPMDTTNPGIWKWYGTINSESTWAYGRSKSWSAVEPFYDYVTTNSGYGLVSAPDAPYYSGEPGDLIQMGRLGEYRHIVIITEVIEDEGGQVVDYLINSNTANFIDYPASAYTYATQRLIKIYGYND